MLEMLVVFNEAAMLTKQDNFVCTICVKKKKNNKINKEFSSQRKETVILLSTNMAAMTTAESSGFQVFDMI